MSLLFATKGHQHSDRVLIAYRSVEANYAYNSVSPNLNVVIMIPKVWPLCSDAKLNLGDRVLGETEKNSFDTLLAKGGQSEFCAPQNCVPNQKDLMRSFTAMAQGWGC